MNTPTYLVGTVQTKAYRLLRENVYEVLGQYDLNPTYWSMLGIIMEARDGVRQVDIANALHVKPPMITTMARTLIKQGIVQSVPNQFDGRAKLLAITPAGKKYIRIVESTLAKRLDQLLTGLTENDLAIYHKVLTTIINNSEII